MIRLIAVKQSEAIEDTRVAEASFQVAWGKMLDGEPLVCAKTGTQFEPHPVLPSAAILDVSHSDLDCVFACSPFVFRSLCAMHSMS